MVTRNWIRGALTLLVLSACGDGVGGRERDTGTSVEADVGVEAGPAECSLDVTLGIACETNEACDDGCFCNGTESCGAEGVCVKASEPACTTAIECAEATCDEASNRCILVPDHAMCSDGDACNGAERCDLVSGACRSGSAPFCNDDDSCTVDSCDPVSGCIFLARDLDGDGFRDGRCGGSDCDDDPRFGRDVFPGAPENCTNRRDDNCDGLRDFNERSCIPDNDTCASARILDGPGTYSGATRSLSDDVELRCGNGGADAYFLLNVPELRDVRVTVAGGTNTTVALGEAVSCEEGPSIACGTGSPATVLRRSVPAGDYVIVVEQSVGGAFDLTVSFSEPTEVPRIDSCDAETETIREGGTYMGMFAEVNDNYMLSCQTLDARDAVYRLRLDEPKDVQIDASVDRGSVFVALVTDCEDTTSTLSCQPVNSSSPLRARNLPAGDYFVMLESTTATSFALNVSIIDPVPRPPGDACAEPIDITPAVGETRGRGSVDLSALDFDGGTGCGGGSSSFRDAFFSFTLDEVSDVTATTNADGLFHTGALRSECGLVGSELACRSTSTVNSMRFRSLDPGTYTIVATRSSTTGTLDASVEFREPTPIPGNDLCENAIDISGGYSSIDTLATFADDVAGCSGFRYPDAFYTFTLEERKDVLISARRPGGAFDFLTLTLRTDCEDTRNEACDSGAPAIINRTLEPGTYFLFVESPESTADDFVLQASFFDPI